MFDELEERVARRDYKLEYVWPDKCPVCEKRVTILLHRDEYDLQHNRSNIKMWCGWGGHITRPAKKCSKCGRFHEIEAQECIVCETQVRAKTRNEIIIEESKLELRRLGKKLKQKRINEWDYDRKSQELNEKIEKAAKELKTLPTL